RAESPLRTSLMSTQMSARFWSTLTEAIASASFSTISFFCLAVKTRLRSLTSMSVMEYLPCLSCGAHCAVTRSYSFKYDDRDGHLLVQNAAFFARGARACTGRAMRLH